MQIGRKEQIKEGKRINNRENERKKGRGRKRERKRKNVIIQSSFLETDGN